MVMGLNQLHDILMQRLEDKGLLPVAITGFIRDVCNIISEDHFMGLEELNKRLQVLGWDPVELDHHTFQLIKAEFEAEKESKDL
jgi:hypothetical protein